MYDKGHLRGLWQLGEIESLFYCADGVVWGVLLRVMLKGGHPKLLHRPIQHIYPLEVCCEPTAEESPSVTQRAEPVKADDPSLSPVQITEFTTINPVCRRSTRMAANQAQDRILSCTITDWHWCWTVSHSTGGGCTGLHVYLFICWLPQACSKQFLISQARKWVWLCKWLCPGVGVVISNSLGLWILLL